MSDIERETIELTFRCEANIAPANWVIAQLCGGRRYIIGSALRGTVLIVVCENCDRAAWEDEPLSDD